MLQAVAVKEEGVSDVLDALDRHFRYLQESGELRHRRRARLRERVVEVAEQKLRARLWSDPGTNAWIDERLAGLEGGTLTPFGVADELLARSGPLMAGTRRE